MPENIDKEQQQTEVIYENTPEREQLISIANELGVLSYRINRAYYINTSIIIPSDMKPVEELTTEEVHSLGLKIIQLLNNNLSAKDLHNNECDIKKQMGWKYGEVFDEENKTDPTLISYDQLPSYVKTSDTFTLEIIRHFGNQIIPLYKTVHDQEMTAYRIAKEKEEQSKEEDNE